MDVQPPTPIDAVQAETQPAIDALRRLASTRDAFARTLETTPSMSDASGDQGRNVLGALPAFWAAAGPGSHEPRRVVLAHVLADVMKEQATLRGLDGTLSHAAATLASSVAAAGSDALPAGVHARELILGELAHAGSLIITDDAQPDLALLFTAHGGWEAFDSLDRLLDTTRRRLLESIDASDASGMGSDSFAEAKIDGRIGSRDIVDNAFATLAERMIAVQAERIALAVDDYDLDRDDADAATRLTDRVRYELSSTALLDIERIEDLREARLLESATAGRLARVPDDVRVAWYAARDSYNDTLAAVAMFRLHTGIQPPLSLHAFASRELSARLRALGITESPEEITVDIGRVRVLPAILEPLDPLPGSTVPRRLSLIDLACQNIGRFAVETLHATTTQGTSLRDRLGQAAISDMIRELDIANRFQAHLEQHLRQGPTGALARKLAMAVQAARMRLEAAEARLSYYFPGEPRSFIDDRDERGFRWVDAVLNAPAGERRVDRHAIAVSQVTYRQAALEDILLFATRAPESAPRVVVYTPGAPDGLTFREFASRQDAAKRFFYHPAFREYLLDRLPAEFAAVSPNGATRTFDGDRLAHWVLGAPGDATYTRTAEPFDEREIRGDFLAAAYDASVEKQRRDTRFLARSTRSADSDALLGYLTERFNASPATQVVAAAIVDVPASLARLTQASWRFYDHVKAGDTGEAFVAFTAGYVASLGLAGPPVLGTRRIAASIVRSTTASRGVASTTVRLAPPRVRFEERYAARDLSHVGTPDHEGVFHVRGQSYIEQDGTHFLVRRDADYGRWRLAPRRGAPDARFTGPLIERVDGRWVYAHDLGLRGGMRRIRRHLDRLSLRDNPGQPPAVPADRPLPRAAEPAAPPRLPFPAHMEGLRAEALAAQADNPSAAVLLRTEGDYLKVIVEPRSGFILDEGLHPDVATLSAHQRRVFLHELEARFPLAAERAEVLQMRGWARNDGRRLPSPPHSPRPVADADVQSPSISSSSGDSLPPEPTLSSHQQARWDEALAVARTGPRTATLASNASHAVVETLSPAEIVPRDEWPARAWLFSERPFQPGPHNEGITLGEESLWFDSARGVRSYPLSVRPPETPVNLLAEALGVSPAQQAGGRDPLGYWVQIDTARLRHLQREQPVLIELDSHGFEMHRRLLPSGEYQYTLTRVAFPMRFQPGLISGIGRRIGDHPPPLMVRP